MAEQVETLTGRTWRDGRTTPVMLLTASLNFHGIGSDWTPMDMDLTPNLHQSDGRVSGIRKGGEVGAPNGWDLTDPTGWPSTVGGGDGSCAVVWWCSCVVVQL